MKMGLVLLIAIGGIVFFSGCARLFKSQAAAGKHGAMLAISAETTPFYRDGPQQGRGPDRQLSKDTLVTLVKHAFGYSKVRLEGGEQGFVANEDLIPAPDRLIAQTNTGTNDELPPAPPVKLPSPDISPELEPTPIPEPLMPQ
jgi:hypothetical protein